MLDSTLDITSEVKVDDLFPIASSSMRTSSRKHGEVLVVSERHVDAEMLCELLRRAGYQPRWSNDPANLRELGRRMPEFLATVFCHLSRHGRQPQRRQVMSIDSLPDQLQRKRIIVVSDCVAEDTVISLLRQGAHHCFNLSDSPRVLQVRLEAALRRHERSNLKRQQHGDILFDLQKRRVSRAGRFIDLSPKEFELAHYLFANRGRVVGNSELMTSIWSLPPAMDTRRIDTAACRVRKKLGLVPELGWELKRLRRLGYRLVRVESRQALHDPDCS